MYELPERKRAFILGAGASKAHFNSNYPSIMELFKYASEYNLLRKDEDKDIYDLIYDIYGRNIGKSTEIDMEELITYIEIEIENTNDDYLRKIKTRLIEIIRQTIENVAFSQTGTMYKKFVAALESSDTIITFNWDTVLDLEMGREKCLHDDEVLKLGIVEIQKNEITEQYRNFYNDITSKGIRSYVNFVVKPPFDDYNPKKGYYLKLHGSIDWYYCDNTNCRAYGIIYPMNEGRNDLFCSECYKKLNVLIIPPVLNKKYRQFPVIDRIWNLAQQELKHVQELVIFGYRFPPTDFYSKWLVRNRLEKLFVIKVINPEVDIEKEVYNDFERNIIALFDNGMRKISFYRSYDDFEKENMAKKYPSM